MIIKETEVFTKWINGIKDIKALAAIDTRLNNIRIYNHLGKCRSVGGMVSEIKIDYGPGYRIYFTKKGDNFVILLAGSTKQKQDLAIKKAQKIAQML